MATGSRPPLDLASVPSNPTRKRGVPERRNRGCGAGSVAIIGGGIAGLASAHFLAEAGADVTLFESSKQYGGLGTFFEYDGVCLDRFYHVILPTDEHLLALLETLGIRESVYWSDTSLGFFYGNELYDLNTPLDLLRFKPAAFTDRIRLGLTALYASHVAKPDPLDDITVEAWLTKLSGKRAFDRLWRPLLEAKFGDAYHKIPALWYWASFNREKGTKKEVKGYLRGGYKGLTDKLVESLAKRGVTLRLESPVEQLDLHADGRPTLTIDGQSHTFDRVISTVPMSLFQQMARTGTVADALGAVDANIDYQGVLNVVVLLKRSLTKHYWIPVVDSGVPFQGIVETTKAIDLADSGGYHLVYLLNYVHRSSALFARDAEDVQREYVDALLNLIPDLTRDDVVDAVVFKAPFVEPLYTPGYGKRKPPAELVPGRVYLATTTQIYPDVTAWNSSTGLAQRVVAKMLETAKAGA